VASTPIADPGGDLNAAINRLIKTHYFPVGLFQLTVAGKPPSELDVRGGQTWRNPSIFAGFRSCKIEFATVARFVYFKGYSIHRQRAGQRHCEAAVELSFEPDKLRRH
jgi:hypothetical protein